MKQSTIRWIYKL